MVINNLNVTLTNVDIRDLFDSDEFENAFGFDIDPMNQRFNVGADGVGSLVNVLLSGGYVIVMDMLHSYSESSWQNEVKSNLVPYAFEPNISSEAEYLQVGNRYGFVSFRFSLEDIKKVAQTEIGLLLLLKMKYEEDDNQTESLYSLGDSLASYAIPETKNHLAFINYLIYGKL